MSHLSRVSAAINTLFLRVRDPREMGSLQFVYIDIVELESKIGTLKLSIRKLNVYGIDGTKGNKYILVIPPRILYF
jgi:hypothetical protein